MLSYSSLVVAPITHPVLRYLSPMQCRFEAEAGRVLEELGRFAELERSTAADFTAGLAAQLERLFAAPAALAATGTAAGCC